jgi:hypothetical protein
MLLMSELSRSCLLNSITYASANTVNTNKHQQENVSKAASLKI